MPDSDRLEPYIEKRDFQATPEPSGTAEVPVGYNLFVIQEHAARRLHYDFRMEIGGALKSWAVPKGPSTDPREKRLAVPTEDHPLGYASFEGVIPEGQYGAGRVIVWDAGTYTNLTQKDGEDVPIEHAVEHGYIAFHLEGKKLRGGFALTRFKTGKDEAWLLVKMKDEHAKEDWDVTKAKPESVLTGRTIEEVS